jgi:hypothetical protein
MWRALEPYHMVTYFAPESREATARLGCKGGWMSYFGLRAAPLGAVAPEVLAALFYNFHVDRVRRAIPAAWQGAPPADFLVARLTSMDAALRRLLADGVDARELREAAALAKEAALAAPIEGRALAAANAVLEWPTQPHLVLWHAQTLLRESRGDAHVAALVSAALDPCEALVAYAADGLVDAEYLRDVRGWSPAEWAAATERLAERGLLDSAGRLSATGQEIRAWVEERTDLGATRPWRHLGAERSQRLLALAGPFVRRVVDGGGFVVDNPMGLKPLAASV